MKNKERQREFGFMGWGGKRRGAGRKPVGERAGVPHVKRERLAARYPVLVTLRVRAGLASLRADDVHALLRQAFAAAASAEFRTIEYSVQSNHVHALVEASDERALTRGMTGLAVRIARGLNPVASGRVDLLGPIPREVPVLAARGAKRTGLRPSERAQARLVAGAPARRVLVGSVLRWLEAGERKGRRIE